MQIKPPCPDETRPRRKPKDGRDAGREAASAEDAEGEEKTCGGVDGDNGFNKPHQMTGRIENYSHQKDRRQGGAATKWRQFTNKVIQHDTPSDSKEEPEEEEA
eukprot:CAMPEP_0198152410 /NCGR_PEP_ID=MMETSP1443-20131203/59719_1 /TAXON_ID=186043 /ORGANISM="Entomoneis sp., Strain CCMP2396" /LENGTH=102 /DNA_ID=CAMNT_0043818423 /DNA_START=203 /DNA_END=508 /DNA_ORIENTATION=+